MQMIKFLGTPTIMVDGVSSRLNNSRRAIALLVYLTVHDEPQSREKVADLLWEGVTTSQSLQRLRELLARVRRVLPALQTTRQTVSLARTNDIQIDYRFIVDALVSNDLAHLETALPKYTGELLADFALPGNPPFNAWLQIEREKLKKKVEVGWQTLITHYVANGRQPKAIDAARLHIAQDELNEAAHRILIRLLARVGQTPEALEQYERLRSTLQQVLGVKPEPETVALVKNIDQLVLSNRQPSRHWDGATVPSPQSLSGQSIVPFRRNPDFVGRTNTLRELAKRLLNAQMRRPVVVSGIGGIGKTQLAVEFAYRFGRFFEAVYWLNCTDRTTILEDAMVIGGQRGMQLYNEQERLSQNDKVARVQRAWQNTGSRLLIFDNCTDEDLLLDWVPVTGNSFVLVTSTREEWARAVNIDLLPLDTLPRAESIQFLCNLTPRLSNQQADTIAAMVGDLPLALQLAGGYLERYSTITPTQYQRQVLATDGLQHPSLHGRGSRISATRHVLSLTQTFGVSYNQLTDDAKEEAQNARLLLTCIACCAAAEPIPLSLAMRFLPTDDPLQPIDALTRLQTLGLVRVQAKNNVVVHRLIAKFAKEQAVPLLQAAQAYVIEAMSTVLQELLEQENTIVTLPFAAAHLEEVTIKALAKQLPNAAVLAGFWAKYLAAIVDLEPFAPHLDLAITSVYDDRLDDQKRAAAMSHIAYIAIELGQREQASRLLEDSLNIRVKLEGELHETTAQGYADLGIMALEDGKFVDSRRLLNTAVDILERLPADEQRDFSLGFALLHIGLGHIGTGEFANGRPYIEQALEIYKTILPYPHAHRASACSMIGHILSGLGEHAAAYEHFLSAVKQFSMIMGADNFRTAIERGNVAACLLEIGEQTQALQWATDSFTLINKRYAETPQTAFSHFLMGKLALADGHTDKAVSYLQDSVKLYDGFARYESEKAAAEKLLTEIQTASR